MNLFQLAGIKCQPLSTFGQHFDIDIGETLRNVWIGHKNAVKRVDVEQRGRSCLVSWGGQLPQFDNTFKRFDAGKIADAVVSAFKRKTLVDYIFNESYLLIKWENGSFEEVFKSDLNNTLQRAINSFGMKRQTASSNAVPSKKIRLSKVSSEKELDKKVSRWPRRRKIFPSPKKIKTHSVETISLDQYLYNCKKNGKFSIPENFTRYVANIPTSLTSVTAVLDTFLEREKKFLRSNGYYRMFQKNISQRARVDQLRPVHKQHVISFACDILRHLLPETFFGNSNRIRKRFYSVIAQFITAAKHEAFSLEWFIECFNPRPEWLAEIRPVDAIKVVKLVAADLIGNALKNFFYITECGSSGYELFFYRKNEIESLTASKINEFVASGVLKRVDADDELERRWLENGLIPEIEVTETSEMDNLMPEAKEFQPPAAKVRFLLKSQTSHECRMITIAKKPAVVDKKWTIFMERQLRRRDVVNVLKRFLDFLIGAVGTGIQPSYTNPQLKIAWEKIKAMKGNGNPLYFVKTDISDAFGSVDHARLFKLLDRWCCKFKTLKELTISEWLVRQGKLRKVSRHSFSRKLHPNRVLYSVEYSNRPMASPTFLIDVIRQIVTLQSLRIGRILYRVQVGLCQGGAGGLSPKLCDLYYSGLDSGLRSFTSSNQSFLLRGMDDYLYVSTDKSTVMDFYNLVIQGVPLFNSRFNEKKLVTNLFKNVSVFPYLGMHFDIDLLTVEPNFSRYLTTSVLNFMKLSYGGKDPRLHKEQFLLDRSLNLAALKVVPIVYENMESSDIFLKKVFINSCCLQVQRILALALFLKSSAETLKLIFAKISRKLARTVYKLCPSISTAFTLYTFYQILFNAFHKYDSRFTNVTKIIQMQLVHFYKQIHVKHVEIENLLALTGIQWWKPWKTLKK